MTKIDNDEIAFFDFSYKIISSVEIDNQLIASEVF